MSLSHADSISSTSTNQIFEQLSLSVKSLYKRTKKDDFAILEKELHQKMAEVERQCMAKLLEQYDWNYPSFNSHDQTFKKVSRNKK